MIGKAFIGQGGRGSVKQNVEEEWGLKNSRALIMHW